MLQENMSSGFLPISDINQAVQPQQMASLLKSQILEIRVFILPRQVQTKVLNSLCGSWILAS